MLLERFKFERISDMEEGFSSWSRYEQAHAESTVRKNIDGIAAFRKIAGNLAIRSIGVAHFEEVGRTLFEKGLSRSRVATVLYSMKSSLRYCRDKKGYEISFLDTIKVPAQKRNHLVKTLSKEEIHRAIDDISIVNSWTGKRKCRSINLHRLRWKCLLEVLWSSGMRISEALSLNRNDIDWERREAIITGKGEKRRKVFFSEEAVGLIREYLEARHDEHQALFVSHCEANRWSFSAAQNYLERWREGANLSKHVTFHMFRRSFASFIFYEFARMPLLLRCLLSTLDGKYI